MQAIIDASIIGGLKFQKVSLTLSLFGQNIRLRGTLLRYSKPFIEMEINKQTRIFNENTVKEIIPEGAD